MVSEMLGTQTLEYDDGLAQAAAHKRKVGSAMSMFSGGDPFEAYSEFKYQSLAETHRTKQARPLMSPDEVLALPEGKQVLFISGKNLYPMLADKKPYFKRREFAGRFLPNPYHPPSDSLAIPRILGTRRVRIITETAPYPYSEFPQYRSGRWRYVEGFKP